MARRRDGSTGALRALAAAIPRDRRDYGPWWAGPTGRRLLARLQGTVAEPVARAASARSGRRIEPDEVIGLAVEALAPPSQLARALRSPMTADPEAYLVRSLANALVREQGGELTLEACRDARVAPASARTGEPRIVLAIELVCRTIAPLTPSRLRLSLPAAVERIVDRAADGALSRLHARAPRDGRLLDLGWTEAQLRALVNVVVGARPDHARSSLVAGYLRSEDWRPHASGDHRAALKRYARRMHRSEVVHELLAG